MTRKKKKLISIGIPCYNEELNVIPTYKALKKITDNNKKYNYEFIFVDNSSLDKTRENIKKLAKKDKRIIGVFLSRNFGPEASAHALINNVSGDAFIGLPADLQDPPELILKFLQKWEQGNNIVVGVYTNSEEDFFTAFIRKGFYNIFKKISNIEIPVNASGTGLLDRKTIDALKKLPEKYRFYRGLRAWIGFKTGFVAYKRRRRRFGKSSYSLISYFKHAERGLFGFSYLMLDLMVYTSLLLVSLSFIFILGYLFMVFVFGNPINASIPVMLTIVFFGGIQLLAIGIIGKYIQVIVEEVKNRPLYIVEKKINFK